MTPAACRACFAYFPAGTVAGSPSTTTRPGLARSARLWMLLGLPLCTMISSRFLAKGCEEAMAPDPVSLSMLAVSALAKTSAGAPCWIWVTRLPDPL